MASKLVTKEKPLVVNGVGISFDKTILKNVSFSINNGEVLAIVGVSGCGKTTILKAIAGLEKISSGEIKFAENKKPNVGMIFQESSLFPWMSVESNINSSGYMQNLSEKERNSRTSEIASEVGLIKNREVYPGTLSGGMAQRAEIARVLAANNDLILMDEPFSKLDIQTRYSIYDLVNREISNTKVPVILVTHNIEEALFLADRILILSGSPANVQTELVNPLPRPRKIEMLKSVEMDEIVLKIEKRLQDDFENKRI